MNKIIYIIVALAFYVLIISTNNSFAQGLSINATGTAADASSMLDVASTTSGMLVPRMTTLQRTGISYPAKGLLVYDSTLASFYYNSGTPSSPSWTALGGGTSLPTGTNGQVLTMVGGVPTWVSPSVFHIVSTTGSNGTISPLGVSWTASNQIYTITPNTGSYISDVTVDGVSVGAVSTYTFTSVAANHTISAAFTAGLPIGSSFGGGKLAYYLQPGDLGYSPTVLHGLIASTSDLSTGKQWYNGTNLTTGATGSAIGTGSANTAAIIASQGAGSYAASICNSYTGGGYSDWYLPNSGELDKLYLNKTAIGGFTSLQYWSSSEYASNTATSENFNLGTQTANSKANLYYVRAIRAF